MPITFPCPHCSHSIKASSKHANRQFSCPKCQEKLTVPAKRVAKRKSPATKAPPREPSAKKTPPRSTTAKPVNESNNEPQFDESKIVDFEAQSESASDANHSTRSPLSIRIDPNSVSIPKSVLVLQGGLLAVLAILAFALGLLVGRQGSSTAESRAGEAQPVTITGKVEYATKAGITTGDDQCVVFLLPALKRPETKISIEGLRPDDPRPDDSHPSIQRIRELGGDVSKTDIHGNFELKLLKDNKKQRFYLLAVAGYTVRKRDIPAADRAQIGNYFAPGFSDTLLLDNNESARREYVWKRLSVVDDDTENIEFH